MTISKNKPAATFKPKMRAHERPHGRDPAGGQAAAVLKAVVPQLNLHLHAMGSKTALTLEMSSTNSGLLHVGGNGSDFIVLHVRVRGDTILALDGKELFLAGSREEAMQRLADFLLARVSEVEPMVTAEVVS